MFSGNFRVLIFIDLLATALGSSLILMMILSVSKSQSSPPAGTARNYVFYQVWTDNPDAYLKIIVQNGDNNKWMEGTIQELADSTSGTFIINEDKQDVFAWGPVTEFNNENKVINRNVFNVYSTAEKKGNWVLGVLYYNNKNLNKGITDVVSKPIKIFHHYKTLDIDTTTFSYVTLGNYDYINYNMKADKK